MSEIKKLRISYALLVRLISSPNHSPLYLTLLNLSSLSKGKHIYKSLGGAGELTPQGKEYLVSKFGATDFEGGLDARFQVGEEHVASVIAFFATMNAAFFEISPLREMREELLEVELPNQQSSILTPAQFASISVSFCKPLHQPPGEAFNSGRGGGVPTHRFFLLYDATMPDSVFEAVLNSPVCRLVTEAEIDRGYTRDGFEIGGNVLK